MRINNYDVLINENNASLGIAVDGNEYDLSFFNNEFLHYEIDYDAGCIHVFSEKNRISFGNIDKRAIYYAYKTEVLVIFIGTKEAGSQHTSHYTNAYEACLA